MLKMGKKLSQLYSNDLCTSLYVLYFNKIAY